MSGVMRRTCRVLGGQPLRPAAYQRIGVEEYVLFDVFGEYLRPRLQGYRLEAGRFRPMPPEADGSLLSRTTSLRLAPEGERLRLVDAVTGAHLRWPEEIEAAYALAEERAIEEAAARHSEAAARQAAETRAAAAEEHLRALEQELDRLRKT